MNDQNNSARFGVATWRIWLGFAVLALVVFALHAPRLGTGFVVPLDFQEVDRALALDRENPMRIWSEPHASFAYRPVTQSVHFLTALAGEGSPTPFLIRNFISHLISAWLVMLLGAALTRSWLAGLVASALFALHPASVSFVSVPVYHAYGLIVPLLAVWLVVHFLNRSQGQAAWTLAGAVLLVSLAPWMSENGLWLVVPASAFALWLRASGHRQWGIVLAVPWISALAFLAVRNQIQSIGAQVLTVQDAATYGLKSPLVIASNMLMFQVGAATPFDYLIGMDAMTQGFSRTDLFQDSLALASVALAVVGALVVAASVYLSLLWLWVKGRERRLVWVAVGMLAFFWLSSGLKLVFAQSTEMYVYESSPWWVIGVTAIVVALLAHVPQRFRVSVHRAVAVLVMLVLTGYAFGVHGRIGTLVEKAERIEAPSELGWALLASAEGPDAKIAILVSCRIPLGFSGYGLTRGNSILLEQYRSVMFGGAAERVQNYRAGRVTSAELTRFEDRVIYVDPSLISIVDAQAAAVENALCTGG